MYNTKNYTTQGGDETHIGGKLIIESGAEVVGLVKAPAEKIAASTAASVATLKDDFNNLLDALGIKATS